MDVRYPIGQFTLPAAVSDGERSEFIRAVSVHPAELRRALAGRSEADLEARYRTGGWTVRQVVHHLVDSHVNSYVRFRLALTEDQPSIKTYDEARWAELPDVAITPVEVSLRLLEALHTRWTALLESLQREQFARTLYHPEWGVMTVDQLLALYAWHGAHHVAHVRQAWARAATAAEH